MMTPTEQHDQMIRLQLALDSVTKAGSDSQMKPSDIEAMIEILKLIAELKMAADTRPENPFNI